MARLTILWTPATPMPETQPDTIDLEVSPSSVRARMDAGEAFLLLDCRTQAEWETSRIESALLIPLQEMSLRIHELDDWMNRPVVVYCHRGPRSLIITRLLRHVGFTHVQMMSGGIDRWSQDVDPDVPTY